MGTLALALAAIGERLDRIENLLGVSHLTPAQQELEAAMLAEDLDNWDDGDRP